MKHIEFMYRDAGNWKTFHSVIASDDLAQDIKKGTEFIADDTQEIIDIELVWAKHHQVYNEGEEYDHEIDHNHLEVVDIYDFTPSLTLF